MAKLQTKCSLMGLNMVQVFSGCWGNNPPGRGASKPLQHAGAAHIDSFCMHRLLQAARTHASPLLCLAGLRTRADNLGGSRVMLRPPLGTARQATLTGAAGGLETLRRPRQPVLAHLRLQPPRGAACRLPRPGPVLQTTRLLPAQACSLRQLSSRAWEHLPMVSWLGRCKHATGVSSWPRGGDAGVTPSWLLSKWNKSTACWFAAPRSLR